jgi:hypothetical protein
MSLLIVYGVSLWLNFLELKNALELRNEYIQRLRKKIEDSEK